MKVGEPVAFDGHTFELLEVVAFSTERSDGLKAQVSIDGGQAYAPAITRFTQMGTDIGTPSVKTGFTKDIYLTLEKATEAGATEAQVKVFIKPLILWMWIGGGLVAIGTVLSAFPGKRRRNPTAPTSAPVPTTDPEVANV
jgi:cytochrome c-type biogenesis protein CcmF